MTRIRDIDNLGGLDLSRFVILHIQYQAIPDTGLETQGGFKPIPCSNLIYNPVQSPLLLTISLGTLIMSKSIHHVS